MIRITAQHVSASGRTPTETLDLAAEVSHPLLLAAPGLVQGQVSSVHSVAGSDPRLCVASHMPRLI